jgi:cell division protein FtsW
MNYITTYDRWLLLAAMLLAGLGTLMIYSSTSVVTPGLARKNITEFYYFKKHITTLFVGFLAMFAAYKVRPQLLRKMAVPLLVVSFVLLVLVFVPGLGVSAGGAKRWIRLWPSTFQPSELVKLAMVIFLARYMSMEQYRTDRFVHFAVPVAVTAVFQPVFLMQPDFGSTMSLGVLTLAMLFLSGARLRYIFYLLALSFPVVVKLLMEPYRLKRIISFLDPWKNARGSGFQLVQSFIAFGRGGLTGVGLGKSRQKLDFLPEVHTDFIFSMVGEELGFVVAALIVTLFMLLFWRGIRIANNTKDSFAYYLTFGLSMMLAFQALVNFGVVTGLLPTKGLPLPFLSYGGSALLINMAAVGMLLNLSRPVRHVEPESDDLTEVIRRKKARRTIYGGGR